MADQWELGGIRIYTQKVTGVSKQIIAELQPLRAGSIYQVFGWEEEKKKLSGVVVGTLDMNHLKTLTTSGDVTFILNTPFGSAGNYYVRTVEQDRTMSIYQTMRPDLDCDAPVYNVDIELIPVISGV